MPILVSFTKSERSNKKYVLRFLNPKFSIHFGSKNSSVFLDHKDETKNNNYIKRHQALNEDWNSKHQRLLQGGCFGLVQI